MTPEDVVADDAACNGPYGARNPSVEDSAPNAWLRDVAFMCLGGLVAIAVLAPQVRVANHNEDEARAEYRELVDDFEAHCTVDSSDGSARCEPNTFPSDYGKAGAK